MKKAWSTASLLLIALLGVTSIVCTKGVFEGLAARQVGNWLAGYPTIYTSQLTDAQRDGLASELESLANKKGSSVVSVGEIPA